MIKTEFKPLDDELWLAREAEIMDERCEEIIRIRNHDAYWEPVPATTELEIQWDKARLDALNMMSSAMLRGLVGSTEIRLIAEKSEAVVNLNLPVYEDPSSGYKFMPGMITAFNEDMLRSLAAIEGE